MKKEKTRPTLPELEIKSFVTGLKAHKRWIVGGAVASGGTDGCGSPRGGS